MGSNPWGYKIEKGAYPNDFSDKIPKINIDVFKLSDEWFLISQKVPGRDNLFYKCDQLDGLKNFLSYVKVF